MTQGTQGTAITTAEGKIDTAETDIDALEVTQGTQATSITTNKNAITALDTRLTTGEGKIVT